MMTAMEIEPEKFRPQYKVYKIFRVGVKTRIGRVSGNKFFRPSTRIVRHQRQCTVYGSCMPLASREREFI